MSYERDETQNTDNLLSPLEELLAAGLHIGTRIKTESMEEYIYRVRPDGLFILNVGKTNERISLAAKFISRFEPSEIIVISSRLYGRTPVQKFCQVIRATPIVGRFLPGLISNPSQPKHVEPQLVIVTDPRADKQAMEEASLVGIPVVALCDTDNFFSYVDLAIPVNNKGRRALAMAYWLLARQVLRERKEIPVDSDIQLSIDDFETKLKIASHKTDDEI
ncbi:30S ribosomal protein S2 [miscellaneous Crenarchaeota group archaeon SMTZ-80]|nr:MAG: 30S ribosomal protein S2 [miscellaneous Crenarchaeota group archaeon SMTZ-80]